MDEGNTLVMAAQCGASLRTKGEVPRFPKSSWSCFLSGDKSPWGADSTVLGVHRQRRILGGQFGVWGQYPERLKISMGRSGRGRARGPTDDAGLCPRPRVHLPAASSSQEGTQDGFSVLAFRRPAEGWGVTLGSIWDRTGAE